MGAALREDRLADGDDVEAVERDVQRSFDRISEAPLLILLCLTMESMDVYPDTFRQVAENVMAIQSLAMAGQNLLLAASAEGLGACWMCAPLFCQDTVKLSLELPDDWSPQALLALGWPLSEGDKKERRPVHDVVKYI